jgi:hypothetical protein
LRKIIVAVHFPAMTLTPLLRKLALITHIILSVGWLGAILPYLALAVAGLVSHDDQTVRAAYVAMELIAKFVIIPLSLATVASGLVQALGSSWGLFRHWWVVAKFILTTGAAIILLVHMQAIERMARIATTAASLGSEFNQLRIQLVLHPIGGIVVLVAVTAISVLKPWGSSDVRTQRLQLEPGHRNSRVNSIRAFRNASSRTRRSFASSLTFGAVSVPKP